MAPEIHDYTVSIRQEGHWQLAEDPKTGEIMLHTKAEAHRWLQRLVPEHGYRNLRLLQLRHFAAFSQVEIEIPK